MRLCCCRHGKVLLRAGFNREAWILPETSGPTA